MPPIRPYDSAFADQARDNARAGLGRAEIAAAVGASLVDFEAWATEHPGFAAALADADTLARSWWELQPRLALESGKSFKAAAWSKAMAQRYGRSSDRPPQNAKAERPRVSARIVLPDNGRERRPPRART